MKFFAVFFFLAAGLQAHAQVPPGAADPPSATAKAYLLLDFQSGRVLAASNAEERIEPASLTKLMTAYVLFDALNQKRLTLRQRVTVSEKAWRTPGARTFLEPGSQPTIEELLHGMIVQSGNDASIALAEAAAGSEQAFVEMMNREAARLGLESTRFANATGLSHPQHYSNASDLARLAEALIRDFPQFFPLYRLQEYTYNNITQYNRNKLLGRDPHVDGLKTGYTESAGFCLIATAKRGDRRLISVAIDSASESARIADSQKLLNYGFEAFESFRLYAKGQTVHEIPVWKGAKEAIRVGFADDFFITVPKGLFERLGARLESMQPLLAPVRIGERAGTLHLMFDGHPYGEYPVIALESISVANLFVRTWHSLRLIFN